MSYKAYSNISTIQKDLICDGIEKQKLFDMSGTLIKWPIGCEQQLDLQPWKMLALIKSRSLLRSSFSEVYNRSIK